MRPEEEFVLEALVSEIGGEFVDGDDPPDAYLMHDGRRIAVEVSRLIQHTINEHGQLRPRLSDDVPALTLADHLDDDLRNNIPDKKFFFVVIPSPVNDVRRTREQINQIILEMIQSESEEFEGGVCGNLIQIKIINGDRPSGKKIVAALPNRNSSADIGLNVSFLLQDRITTKNRKREVDDNNDEYWLALMNDYWIADARSYQNAFDALKIEHEFDKILLVEGNRNVHQLY